MPARRRSRLSLLLLVAVAAACGSGPAPAAPSRTPLQVAPPKVRDIDAAYGTLRFRGTVERYENADTYEYVARLSATFDPHARTNSTTEIHLSAALFTATIPNPADPNGPWRALYRDGRVIAGDFRSDGETRTLPELRFVLSKTIEAQARHVGLGVTDDRMMWPVPGNLKDM